MNGRSTVRMDRVQTPMIPVVGEWVAQHPGTISLGQGVVHYAAPAEVHQAAAEAVKSDPRVDRYLIELLADKLNETMAQLMEVLFVPVEKRVLRVVDRLADAFDDGGDVITVRVRQEDIAAMAGTRRQTANRPLKAAEAEGAIRIRRGRVEVVDREVLARLAD